MISWGRTWRPGPLGIRKQFKQSSFSSHPTAARTGEPARAHRRGGRRGSSEQRLAARESKEKEKKSSEETASGQHGGAPHDGLEAWKSQISTFSKKNAQKESGTVAGLLRDCCGTVVGLL